MPDPRAVSLLLCGALSAALVFAQDEPVVFRSSATLIEFTMTAMDGDDEPVVDLRPEEVQIRDGGAVRETAFLRYEGAPPPSEPPAVAEGAFTNRPEYSPGPTRNVTAIVMDALNTSPRDQRFAQKQIIAYLSEIEPQTRVGVFYLDRGLSVVHDFTDDPASLRESLRQSRLGLNGVQERPIRITNAEAMIASYDEAERSASTEMLMNHLTATSDSARADVKRRVLTTLSALETLGDHLAAIPGRKNVVWVTGGIPMFTRRGADGKDQMEFYESWIQQAGRRLATQGVALYSIDSQALTAGSDYVAEAPNQELLTGGGREAAAEMTDDPRPALEKLAAITGGRAIFNSNDMTRAIQAAASDVHAAYTVGFYADEEADGSWHDVAVRTTRPGVKLLTRRGYVAETPADTARSWTELDWGAAVYNPLGATSMPIDARAGVTGKGDKREAILIVQLGSDVLRYQDSEDGGRMASVELAIVDKASNGSYNLQTWRLQIPYDADPGAPPFRFRHQWRLMPDADSVRVIARDQLTGGYGSLDLRIDDIPKLAEE